MDNILPICETKDVMSLGCTNKFFALVTTDMFWRQKLTVDYNFTGSGTARTSGWKFIHQRLRNSRVFVWGCVTFSFCFTVRGSSFVNVSTHARPIATIQRGQQRTTWVVAVPGDDLLGCSFSN